MMLDTSRSIGTTVMFIVSLLLAAAGDLSTAFLSHHHHLSSAASSASSSWRSAITLTPSSPVRGIRRAGVRTLQASGLSKAVTAVPNFLGKKLLDGIDEVYLRKCLHLPPQKQGTADIASVNAIIIFFPGIGMGPKHYNETALAIQRSLSETYGLQTYIVIAKFFNNLGYLPNEPDRRLTSIIEELTRRGVSPRLPIGVIGHSGGAFLAYDTALTKSQAFVHLGSTLNSKGR